MIEKFSDEELKQIVKELGFRNMCTKALVCKEETEELYKIWQGKPQANHQYIFRIIDITLCNYTKKNRQKRYSNERYDTYGTTPNIEQDIKGEYKQMFQEIIEIIKKHNRKWEGDTVEQKE